MLLRVFLAVKDPGLRRRMERLLDRRELEVLPLAGDGVLWERLLREEADLIVLHKSLVPESIIDLTASVRNLPGHPDLVVLVDKENARDRAALLSAGCLAVLYLGLGDGPLQEAMLAILNRRHENGLQRLRADVPWYHYSLNDFATESLAMRRLMDLVHRVVITDSVLLILGETGVGKERLARTIHTASPRSGGPFLAVNCAALPEALLESELFGHEQGAFTGAIKMHRGHFELAHGGTIFLDEISDLPTHLQGKLLRVIESREFQRVGGEKPIKVDVRLMAASNRDLEKEMAAGRFRADLYYRLAVVTLLIPPLRERPEDISPLVQRYLGRFREAFGQPSTGIHQKALDALAAYAWPGNVRELINVLERAVLLCRTGEIRLEDLPASIARCGSKAEGSVSPETETLDQAILQAHTLVEACLGKPLREGRHELLAAFEKQYLVRLLEDASGKIGKAARQAGISERALYDMMRRHGIWKEDFKASRQRAPRRDP
jgi:two-component system response regulator AtoC